MFILVPLLLEGRGLLQGPSGPLGSLLTAVTPHRDFRSEAGVAVNSSLRGWMGASDTGPEKHAQDHRGSQPITFSSRKLVLGKGDQTGGPAWGPFLKTDLCSG